MLQSDGSVVGWGEQLSEILVPLPVARTTHSLSTVCSGCQFFPTITVTASIGRFLRLDSDST